MVGSGPVPGGLALSRSELSEIATQRSAAVSRYFGSVWNRNRSRSRTPNFTELETEPKNRTTDYSVRFRFGVRFSSKNCPG